MLVTEEEARERWCHQSAALVETRCLGSGCMAWRWVPSPGQESMIEAIERHRDENGSTLFGAKSYVEQTPSYRRAQEPIKGYCGLAGKPE